MTSPRTIFPSCCFHISACNESSESLIAIVHGNEEVKARQHSSTSLPPTSVLSLSPNVACSVIEMVVHHRDAGSVIRTIAADEDNAHLMRLKEKACGFSVQMRGEFLTSEKREGERINGMVVKILSSR
jgi:hypothetical protein